MSPRRSRLGQEARGPWVPGIGPAGPLPAGCQSPEYWKGEDPGGLEPQVLEPEVAQAPSGHPVEQMHWTPV